MAKSNLLFIITKLELGGAQKQLLSLINSLDKSRFNLHLFTAWEGFLVEDALAISDLTFYRSKFLEPPINPINDILALLEIRRFIKINKITIVHTHSSKAGIVGRLAAYFSGVKTIVHTVHGWPFNDYQTPWLRALYIWLERISCGFTSRIIVVSCHDREVGLKNGIGEPAKYRLVRYGIDRFEFSVEAGSIRKEFGFADSDFVIGSIACFKPQKSPEDFVRLASSVAKRVPGTKFLLVGDGQLRSSINRLISEYGLGSRITLAGWRRDIPRVISAMDIFVLTSLWEGLPISVLEAMAAAKPVVATDTGGIREVISNGVNGFLVSRRNISQMSDVVITLLKDNGLKEALGQKAAKSITDDLSVETMSRSTENIYAELLVDKGTMYVN
ncbi:MAG: glycosyltransferase family 4 protein [Candidatus Omnitrophica bacterium]|nr:glycosyltransferase family 4 protein [Candidatus Omnitrophota bacterium]